MKALLMLCLLSSVLSATVINIPVDFANIQDGIISADDGDTVLVMPGTYVENIDFCGRNITVGSLFITTQDTSYISQTIIDGNQNGSVVSFIGYEDSTAILSGFTLVNGNGTFIIEYPNGDRYYNGGGIYCLNADPRLEYITIMECSCSFRGGAVYLESSNSKLHNLLLQFNAAYAGGGIYSEDSEDSEITDCRILNNNAEETAGGIFLYSGVNCNISGIIISNNNSDGECGGILLSNSECTFENSEISNNNGQASGGIAIIAGTNILQNLIVTGNSGHYGGGIYMMYSQTDLNNVEVSHNVATQGGGVYCWWGNEANFNNVLIRDNFAGTAGGGICCYNDQATYLNRTTIKNNRAGSSGGGICSRELYFSENERSNIYMNHAGVKGMDIYFHDEVENTTVYVDSFTVSEPDDYFIYAENAIPYDIQHGLIEQVAADLYLSPQGSNANTGLTTESPLKTITYALAKIIVSEEQPWTIFLAEGTYSSSSNSEILPINMKSDLTISGASQHEVIIDAEGNNKAILFYNDINCSLNTLSLINGYGEFNGGILSTLFAQLKLENVTLAGSHSGNCGGAIYSNISEIELDKVLIYNNSADNGGGAIFCSESDINIVNTTMVANAANPGGAIYGSKDSDIVLINCLLWENQPHEITLGNNSLPSNIVIENSDVQGGEAEIQVSNGNLQWLDNNLNEDPLLTYPPESFFTLSATSPCIDAGTPYFYWNGEVCIELEEDEYYGSAPDMGYAEYFVNGIDEECKIENVKLKISNYPNPFNPMTMITFFLPEKGNVTLEIYNLKGQLVKRLIDEKMSAGKHTIEWDGQNAASGIYLTRLISGKQEIISKKMLLLK